VLTAARLALFNPSLEDCHGVPNSRWLLASVALHGNNHGDSPDRCQVNCVSAHTLDSFVCLEDIANWTRDHYDGENARSTKNEAKLAKIAPEGRILPGPTAEHSVFVCCGA
jgi:hypothetical protein